jgi:hypothetical protein
MLYESEILIVNKHALYTEQQKKALHITVKEYCHGNHKKLIKRTVHKRLEWVVGLFFIF